jgi:hypothetical protein
MHLIKHLDKRLMTILAYSWRYRDLTNRDLAKKLQIRNILISTLISTGFAIDILISGWSPLNILGSLFWLVAFYEWRVWFRQRKTED